MPDGFTCDCGGGGVWTGTQCETPSDSKCLSNPCLHGATCDEIVPDGYECTCVPGFTGVICETGKNWF